MDYLLGAALGAALGAMAPYLERKLVPTAGFIAVLAASAWFITARYDGTVGLAFGLVAVAVSAGITWARDARAKRAVAAADAVADAPPSP